jgi:zinc protease
VTTARLAGGAILALVALLAPAPVVGAPLAHREVLSNGIRLLVAERPAIPIVVVQISVPAGSVHDPPDAGGLANLTAALVTRGTARRTGPELDRAIEFVGGSLDGDAGRETATVSLAVLKKDLDLGLDLLVEVLREPVFPEDELQRKAADIQAAITRAEENPESVGARALARVVYPGHPYGRPVTGTVESVRRLDREQVRRFFAQHYRPDGAVIVAVGDVTVNEIRAALDRRLAGWTAPSSTVAPVPQAPAQPPPVVERIARELTQATVYLGAPAVRQTHPDYFPLIVANYILGGGSSSRLYSRVRDERGFAYSVYSYVEPGRSGSAYVVGLQTRLDAVDEAVRLTKEEMARMGRDLVTPVELDQARSYLIGSLPLRMDTSSKVAGLILGLELNGLGLDYLDRFREQVSRVTAADVQRVAARYLDPARFSTILVRK